MIGNLKEVTWTLMKTLLRNGILEPADLHPCFHCGGQAHDYHHFAGYEGLNRIRVIPFCRSCHAKYTHGLGEKIITEKHKAVHELRRKEFLAKHAGHDFYEAIFPTKRRIKKTMLCRTCKNERARKAYWD